MIVLTLIIGFFVVSFGLIVLRGAPYVPTLNKQLRAVFDKLYILSKNDTVVDLGSGDGVVLKAAQQKGASGIGYELNPLLVLFSRWRFRNDESVDIIMADFMRLKRLPEQVTVVYAFTTGRNIEGIGRKLEQWSQFQKLHFISFGFKIKDKPIVRSVGPMHLYLFQK